MSTNVYKCLQMSTNKCRNSVGLEKIEMKSEDIGK